MDEEKVGFVTHFFGKIGVAAVEVTAGDLKVGDTIHVRGHTSDFQQTVESMQKDNESVDRAAPGDVIGIKMTEPARKRDEVYKVLPG